MNSVFDGVKQVMFVKPFAVIGEHAQAMSSAILRRLADEPNCRPVYQPCRIPAPPSEFDVYGKNTKVEAHLKWALQDATCWQEAREFYYFMGKVSCYYSESEKSSWKPQLRLKKPRRRAV